MSIEKESSKKIIAINFLTWILSWKRALTYDNLAMEVGTKANMRMQIQRKLKGLCDLSEQTANSSDTKIPTILKTTHLN